MATVICVGQSAKAKLQAAVVEIVESSPSSAVASFENQN